MFFRALFTNAALALIPKDVVLVAWNVCVVVFRDVVSLLLIFWFFHIVLSSSVCVNSVNLLRQRNSKRNCV
jgi:hypothetical protein